MTTPTPGPTPTPGLTPSPPKNSPDPTPAPTPSPSPQAPPFPRPPWGFPPDIEVSEAWLKTRADCCDNAGDALRRTLPEASDAFAELKQAAPGWSFTGSVPQMQQRWEALNKYLRSQLTQGAESFRLSAGEYHGIDIKAALGIARTSGGN